MARQLLLVRHGEVEGSEPGVLLGSTDLPLSEVGRFQSRLLRRVLPSAGSADFLSSPLSRARETAEIVTAGIGARLRLDPDLREIDFGEWEGRTYDEVEAIAPSLAAEWRELREGFAFPQGESLSDFHSRIIRVAGRSAAAAADTTVIFTHGGVVRALLCHFLGLPFRDYLIFEIGPGSVSTVRLWDNGRGVLVGLRQAENPPQATRR